MQNQITTFLYLQESVTRLSYDLNRPWQDSPCVDWPYGKDHDGYGLVWHAKTTWRVHRVSYALSRGIPLRYKTGVCHHCDRPPCFNPAHLFPGDVLENNRDCVAKGHNNTNKGSKNGFAKLNESKVLEIRSRWKLGYGAWQLSREYGTTEANIELIIYRKTWKHI